MKKLDWLILFSIIFISIIVLKDLFKPGMYTSHDGIHQVVRFYYFDQALRDGQIPPRWAQGLLNGFGYPLFIFSYHMPWFIAEIFHLFGFSIIDSVKLTFLVGFILSGITMYLVQKDIFGRFPAIAGATLYLFAPYRFSNIFVRAAVGDATTFIFAPLLFWAIWKLKEGWSWKWISIGGLAVAGLILSHAMVAALFLFTMLIYFCFSIFYIKNKLSYFKNIFTVLILGGGISAYYFIPSIIERSNTQFQNLMSQIFIGSYFPNIMDLIYSKWGYGVFHASDGAMSVQLGITQWLVILFTVSAVFILPFLSKKLSHKEIQLLIDGKILILMFAFTILMMLSVSLPIWKFISGIVFIDFPWRFLAVSTILVSLCAGLFISFSGKAKTIFTIFLVLSAMYFNRNNLHINQTLPWNLDFILKLEKTTNTYDEYIPKWVKSELVKEAAPIVEASDLKSTFSIDKKTSNVLNLSVNSPQGGDLLINTIYYPGWDAKINGVKSKIYYDNGLIRLLLPKGDSKVELRFKETPLRIFSDIISILSIIIMIIGLIKFKKISRLNQVKEK